MTPADAAVPQRNLRARKVIVLAAALLGTVFTSALGVWQIDRANQKETMQRTLDERRVQPPLGANELARDANAASAQHYRQVRLSGRFAAQHTVFLDNRPMQGRVGFIVLTPLLLESGDAVLVQRGWAPRDALDRTRLPALGTPADEVEVHGSVAPAPSRLLELAQGAPGAAPGPIRQNLDLDEFARETRLGLLPMSIRQADGAAMSDGLYRQWPSPAIDVHKHYGYAAQWFALAALMVFLYVWFQLVRPRLPAAR